MDKRYYRLINRANTVTDEVNWDILGDYSPFETFKGIFNGNNVRKESYFDLMTHFDFKTLLPSLLHVEDRVSMAHGLESRVPFIDLDVIEFAATMPSDVKFKNGTMKHILRHSLADTLPPGLLNRTDKMGFPVPLTEWIKSDARDFVMDIFSSKKARERELVDNRLVLDELEQEGKYGRKIWGFLCLEIWQQQFHDRRGEYKKLLNDNIELNIT
jgi:asparagine synthase (glutamine-hydrolysing)